MTPKEGSPTLRDARDVAKAIEWRKKPDPRFTFRCPCCLNNNLLGHTPECALGKLASITDEALGRDEERSKILEELAVNCAKQWNPPSAEVLNKLQERESQLLGLLLPAPEEKETPA